MPEKYTFTILGGDRRQTVIAKLLLERGHTVRIYGLGELSSEIIGAEFYTVAEKAISECDVIILPLPVTRDNITLNLNAYANGGLNLYDILRAAAKNEKTVILGGVIPSQMLDMAASLGIELYDYYKEEGLQIKNALPSAEGALMIAMENTDKVIRDMPVCVCGYGRIGSCLAAILSRMGADVSVMARRDESLCEIAMNGYKAIRLDEKAPHEMRKALKENEVIFNTVPHIVFNGQVLRAANATPVYIEIASSPGGIDLPAAREMGIRTLFAPSLPGKYAPASAGKYIFETIEDILRKGGLTL